MKNGEGGSIKKILLSVLLILITSFLGGVLLSMFLGQMVSLAQGNKFVFSEEVLMKVLKDQNTYIYCGLLVAVLGILKWLEADKKASKRLMKIKPDGIESALENSRFLTEDERTKLFPTASFKDLSKLKKDGVPLSAYLKGGDLKVSVCSGAHCLVIGSTGSGKTTTFINPMIQILCKAKKGSSMVITDPKGELFSLHSKALLDNGYDVKVLDLRDAYESSRWNPLESIYNQYVDYMEAGKGIKIHTDSISIYTDLKPEFCTKEELAEAKKWFEYHGKAFTNKSELVGQVKVTKQKIYDTLYEDLNDLISVLCPIESKDDPVWEKGARSIMMATLLAMLEDMENPDLGMTKERFCLFNLNKMITNSDDNYALLRSFFEGRSPVSQAVALSRQVLSAAEATLSSYMSIAMDKLSMFNDNGLCALTSATDMSPDDLAEHPTALFLKIPDEKDTRHPLAGVFILCIYKALIKKASTREDLSLPRNVYFILDEFGNMPRIEKFDKMITVGRSRKIWFSMVVQSYSQLKNVYGEDVSEIIKSNCGIKLFIGSNDIETCKEFSELCGNMTVYTNSVSGSTGQKSNDVSYSSSVQTRPLIYPSELQKLNNANTSGNAIAVTFGNYPLKAKYTPSYKCNLYTIGQMKLPDSHSRTFSPDEVFYDLDKRKKILAGE